MNCVKEIKYFFFYFYFEELDFDFLLNNYKLYLVGRGVGSGGCCVWVS